MSRRRTSTGERPPRAAPASEGIVATVEKRGRLLVAEPFFERGGRMVMDRDARARAGDLVLVRPASRSGGHAQFVRRLGRPDVAEDVLEALMLDRGLNERHGPVRATR